MLPFVLNKGQIASTPHTHTGRKYATSEARQSNELILIKPDVEILPRTRRVRAQQKRTQKKRKERVNNTAVFRIGAPRLCICTCVRVIRTLRCCMFIYKVKKIISTRPKKKKKNACYILYVPPFFCFIKSYKLKPSKYKLVPNTFHASTVYSVLVRQFIFTFLGKVFVVELEVRRVLILVQEQRRARQDPLPAAGQVLVGGAVAALESTIERHHRGVLHGPLA